MRVSTAFNKMLAVPGAWVASVTFTPEGVVVGLRRRFRRLSCPHCGWSTRAREDASTRRWRHLDLGASKLWLEAEIRRLACAPCGKVVTEAVPWARHDAWFTRDFEDVVAWLAQRVDKTTVATLLRCSWEAVRRIVTRVVAEAIDDTRLDAVYRIGVDEIAYRAGHRYLTVVADHDRDGAIIWAGEGKSSATLAAFYDELGDERTARLKAVSLDMGKAYAKATREKAPQARQCIDPFHVIQLCNKALDKARRWAWREEQRRNPRPKRPRGRPRKDAPPKPAHTSTSGWHGPAAAASPPSCNCPAPSAPTAKASSPPSSSAYRTPNSRD